MQSFPQTFEIGGFVKKKRIKQMGFKVKCFNLLY